MAVTLNKQNPLMPEEKELAFQSYHNRILPTPRLQSQKQRKHTNKEENMSQSQRKDTAESIAEAAHSLRFQRNLSNELS